MSNQNPTIKKLYHDVTSHFVGEKIIISHIEPNGNVRYLTSHGRTTFKEFTTTNDLSKAEKFTIGSSDNDQKRGVVYLKSNQLSKDPYPRVLEKAKKILMYLNAVVAGSSAEGHIKMYLSNKGDGTVILEEAPGGNSSNTYWAFYRFTQLGNTGKTLIHAETSPVIKPANLFNFHVHPPQIERIAPIISPCLMAEVDLIWHLTGGFVLELLTGKDNLIDLDIKDEILNLIKLNPYTNAALEVLKEGAMGLAHEHRHEAVALIVPFISALHEAGLLWEVLKLVLSKTGFFLAGEILSKILEVLAIPEGEVIEILFELSKWSIELVEKVVELEKECNEGTIKEVKFFYAPGMAISEARVVAAQHGWNIATPMELEKAFYHLKYNHCAYGLLSDGRYAVPVQTDHTGFKAGTNIGKTGGGQGFFYTE